MNRLKILMTILIDVCLLCSCDRFLDLKPRDQKVVKDIEDYRDIMASYMHFLKTPNRPQEPVLGVGSFVFPCFNVAGNLGIYTGETNLNKTSGNYYDKGTGTYTINGKNLLTWLNTDMYAWDRYYEFIGVINLIINGIETAEGEDEDLRHYVKGEALTWRAFSYFKLLQYYAPLKNDRYGIPMYLTPEQDIGTAMPKRATVTECFRQILEDCNEALQLMELTASTEWNCAWRYDFLNAMMASIYTWKAMSVAAEENDWKWAAECATEAMRGRSLTDSPEILRQMFDCRDVTNETDMTCDEFYFRIMDGYNSQVGNFIDTYYNDGNLVDGKAPMEYYKKFKDSDIRKEVYFKNQLTDKYNLLGKYNGACFILFRLAEMYLIKAEALVRQGKTGEARGVMIDFKQARYTEEELIPTDATALLEDILAERCREFYMENDFRWLDMKRLGVTMTRVIQGENFTLEADDFRYCFPIPRKEMELNKNMEQTPGWDNVLLN